MPPPAVPGLSVANSRMMLSSPITSVLGSPRYLRSCGTAPTLANWKMRLRAPMRGVAVDHRVRADPRAGADADVRADHGVGLDDDAVGRARRRAPPRRVGWTRRPLAARAAANSTSATRAAPSAATPRSRHGGPPPSAGTSRCSTSPGSTGRRKRARSTPTRRSRAVLRPPTARRAARAPRRGRRPGITGAPGKVADEVRLVGADELLADGAAPRLDLEHAVDERPREPGAAVSAGSAVAVTAPYSLPAGFGLEAALAAGVVDLHDLVGDVERLVAVEERAARGLEDQRVAVLARRSRAPPRRGPRRCSR